MQVIEAQDDMPIYGAVTLYASLLTFILHVHPDRLDYVDQILVCYIFIWMFSLRGEGKGRENFQLLHVDKGKE